MKLRVVVGSAVSAFVLTLPIGAASSTGGHASLGFRRPVNAALANGLALVVEENHQVASVALQLRYRAGTRDEPRGKEGIALLTQRMMVQATQHVPDGAYVQTLETVGASRRGEATGFDSTTLNVVVPANAVETVLWLWSDQMAFFRPRIDRPLLEQQRRTIETEHSAYFTTPPYGNVEAITRGAIYPEGHPYHVALVAHVPSASMTEMDVKQFHDAHYMPNRAVIAFSGDITPARATALATKYFGSIPKGADDAEIPTGDVALKGELRLDVAARVDDAMVEMAWPTPAYFATGDAELDVVSRLLAGQHTAVLCWALVSTGLAFRVTASQHSHQLGSEFVVRATARDGHTASELASAIDVALSAFRNNLSPGDRVERAIAEFQFPKILGLEDAQTRVNRYSQYLEIMNDSGYLESDLRRYWRVTPTTARDFTVRYLDLKRRVVTRVSVDANAPPGGELRATSFVAADGSTP